jgi:hypothetical protein
VPRLSETDIEALELFDDLANDQELRLDMELRPGDMQFLHNHTCLHDRTAFVDWPEPERKRHLLRLWLAAPGARPLPPIYGPRYGSTTIGDRGGIICEKTRLHAPLEPVRQSRPEGGTAARDCFAALAMTPLPLVHALNLQPQ